MEDYDMMKNLGAAIARGSPLEIARQLQPFSTMGTRTSEEAIAGQESGRFK